MKTITRRLLPFAAACFAAPSFAQTSAHDSSHVSALEQRMNQLETRMRLAAAHVRNEHGKGNEEIRMASKDTDNVKRGGALEEIIVTAQKRSERLQDVPISISVLQGNDLDSSTVRDVTESLSSVPGIAIGNDIQGGSMKVTVRGVAVPTGLAVGPATTAYYLDSAPFGFVQSSLTPPADAYDLDRMEVLRGPQGTLYGASALNGVVRVLTRDADLDRFEFKARGFSSNTEDGGWNYRGDMAANFPIVEGKLAARAVLGYQSLSGWIDKPNQKDVNDTESRVARLKVNAQPTEQLSIGLSAWLSETDIGSVSIANEEMQRTYPGDEPIAIDYEVYNLSIGYEFPGVSVTSMTSYLDYRNEYSLGLNVLSSGSLSHLDTLVSAQTFSQEVSLNSTHAGPWRWTAGAMYRDSLEYTGFTIPPTFLNLSASRPSSEAYALFGELTRSFMDGAWDITVGGRYFEDDVRKEELSRNVPFTPQFPQLITRAETFDATTTRVILAWHPSTQLNLYASYSEGFRSGWLQAAVSPLPQVKPDKLTNYELGSKGSLLGGRVVFDAALYYIDWRDVQQTLRVVFPGTNVCCTNGGINGESASGIGVDFSVTTQPVNALELGANISWNDLSMDEQVFSGGVLLFDEGDRLNESVEYTLGTFANYVIPLRASGYEAQFSVSANYSAEQPRRTVSNNQLKVLNGDPMLLARTSFSIRAPRWTGTIFVDNLNNEERGPNKADEVLTAGESLRVRPRTVGVQVEYHY